MSSASEISSVLSLARPVLPKGPSIEIKLDSHYRSKIYNSGAPVRGEVVLTPWKDTRFDFVSVVLIGVSKTRVDAAQIAQHSSHTFLKLNMPIPESAYPMPRIFEAGHTYTIPFNFVIPQHLTLSACNHKKKTDAVYDQHMRLPPSMGTWGRDDLSPEMARVEYIVKARVVEQPELGGRPIKVMEANHLINVLPTSVEDPPINITSQDKQYCLSKSKKIRKNIFSAKQGRVTATASQPAAVRLSPDGRTASETGVLVHLKFDPSSPEIAAPRLSHVAGKMQSTTWFSGAPMATLPDMGDIRASYVGVPQLSYSNSSTLFSDDIEGPTAWNMRSVAARRDSGYSSEGQSQSDSDNSSSARNKASKSSPVYHETTVFVPFTMPVARKMLLPTFHTCLSSRTYNLHLTLNVGDAKINLHVPVQVAVEPSQELLTLQQDNGLPSFDAAMAQQEEADVDELLRGRVMRQPDIEHQGTSELPGYGDFMHNRRAVTA
ncbi:arrestin [Plectosphaerella cucumerina]|uniref:Arrestin n=1 Tax=Plectosphaerella cucumerina TaxID=40658 RepID=A0A8K0WZT1_9PEZI|nr:arrestin [Plectosphaerella cucumerina]